MNKVEQLKIEINSTMDVLYVFVLFLINIVRHLLHAFKGVLKFCYSLNKRIFLTKFVTGGKRDV